jgi:hypothetical protein
MSVIYPTVLESTGKRTVINRNISLDSNPSKNSNCGRNNGQREEDADANDECRRIMGSVCIGDHALGRRC